jgi:hypothetical protein
MKTFAPPRRQERQEDQKLKFAQNDQGKSIRIRFAIIL